MSPTTSPLEQSPSATVDAIRAVIVAYQRELFDRAALLDQVAGEYEQRAAYWRKRATETENDMTVINRLAAAAQEGEH